MKGEKEIMNMVCEDPLPTWKGDSYLIYYLSSEFAFGSLRDVLFRLNPLPTPTPQKKGKKKKDNTSLSEPKANSEERRQELIHFFQFQGSKVLNRVFGQVRSF